MLYVILGLGLFFVLIGFIVTESNADVLLAGYNTMSEEERKKVDIKNYIRLFRNFHLFLGISFMLLGLVFHFAVSANAAGIFLATYPLVAYLYFIWKSRRFNQMVSPSQSKSGWIFGVTVLTASLLFVLSLLYWGFKEDKITVHTSEIEIEGFYGETLPVDKIEQVELLGELPPLKYRSNGFALGTIKKGYFKTESGESLKLIINAMDSPFLLILTSEGDKIYYSGKKAESTKALYEKLIRVTHLGGIRHVP